MFYNLKTHLLHDADELYLHFIAFITQNIFKIWFGKCVFVNVFQK